MALRREDRLVCSVCQYSVPVLPVFCQCLAGALRGGAQGPLGEGPEGEGPVGEGPIGVFNDPGGGVGPSLSSVA